MIKLVKTKKTLLEVESNLWSKFNKTRAPFGNQKETLIQLIALFSGDYKKVSKDMFDILKKRIEEMEK